MSHVPFLFLAELFFNHLVLGLRDTFWSGASLVYVMEGLAQVEPIPVWNIKTLNNVKYGIVKNIVSIIKFILGTMDLNI